MDLSKFDEGDKILFNQRKQPLEIAEVKENELIVNGPQGGEYQIYKEDDTLLYCKRGNKRYSSYVEELKKVGEWSRENDKWIHSKTGSEIKLAKNEAGFWTVKSEDIELNPIELPKYGYSDKEFAEEDVQKLINKNPEG